MIKVFKSTETKFDKNGLQVLDKYIIDPVVSEEVNGIFQLDFSIPIKKSKHIEKENIVVAPTPKFDNQAFRISQIRKSNGLYHVTCYHIFYDLIHNLIEDISIVNMGASAALDKISSGCVNSHPFIFTTDMSNKTANCRIVRYNPVKALLGDDDNTFVNRWGGEIERNNFKINMKKRLGIDSSVQVRYRKNLTGYEADIDYTQVTTKIMPKAADGVLLPEKYVESPKINHYHLIKTKVVEYSDIKIKDEGSQDSEGLSREEAFEEMRRRARLEFSQNHVDEPRANYKVSFVDLEKTKEYKHIKKLESVNLGDNLKVIHKDENVDVTARVISYKYNPISKSYIELELGNTVDKFTSITEELKRVNDKIETDLRSAVEDSKKIATKLLRDGFGGHVKIKPDRILIMDTDDENTAKKVWMWNKNGLGFSNTGVNGEFGLAMTLDGAIVADYITTGNLNANLIRAGHIKGKNFDLDLDSGNAYFGPRSLTKDSMTEGLIKELKGKDGQSQYVHTRYSDTGGTTGDMFTSPSSEHGEPHKYIGFAITSNKGAPALKSAYTWSKYIGEDGSNGSPGKAGKDGKTPYLHIAWADNSSGSSGFTTSGGSDKAYMGTYTDFTERDSEDYRKYTWVKVKGEDGSNGSPGKDGKDGKIKYNLISNGDFHRDFTIDEVGFNSSVLNKWQVDSKSIANKVYTGITSEDKVSYLHVDPDGARVEINQYLALKKNTTYYVKAYVASKKMNLYYRGESYNSIETLTDKYSHFEVINKTFRTHDSDTHYIQLDCLDTTQIRYIIISEEEIPYHEQWYPSKFDGIGQDGKQGPPGKDGSLAELPPALKAWNGKATEISGKYVFTPELFVGEGSYENKTGIYIGSRILAKGNNGNTYPYEGIVGLKEGKVFWRASTDGFFVLGNDPDRSIYVDSSSGKAHIPMITSHDIKSGAITADKIRSGTITANEIKSGTITASEIAANTITSAEIKSGAITTDFLYPGTSERIVLERGYSPGANNCKSIDANGDAIRLKANAGTYIAMRNSGSVGMYSGGSLFFNFNPNENWTYDAPNEYATGSGVLNLFDSHVMMGWLQYYVYSVRSDRRVKDNIKYIKNNDSTINRNNIFNFVKSVDLATYKYKKIGGNNLSAIAQDVLKFRYIKDYLIAKDSNGLLSINMGNYTSMLHIALQEEIKKREALEDKVGKLEKRIEKLEKLLKKEGE